MMVQGRAAILRSLPFVMIREYHSCSTFSAPSAVGLSVSDMVSVSWQCRCR